MSRATTEQIVACRAVLAEVATRTGLRLDGADLLRDGDARAVERLGHTIIVNEVWVGSVRVACSVTFFPTDAVETMVAAVSQRIAARARIAEVDRAA